MSTPPRQGPLWPLLANEASDEGALWLQWLVRLRWVAVTAQAVTLIFSVPVLASPWLLVPLALVMGFLVLGNLRALQILDSDRTVDEDVLVAQLAIDVFALTGFFILSGGAGNPFTILYVIHVAMGSVMLRSRLAAVLTGIVLACYGLLHVVYLPLHLESHALDAATLTVFGQVAAFTVASVSVAAFVVGLATSLRRRNRQLLQARDRTARTDRLRSVGTLAAGAAHELNTPLSTIGLRMRRILRRHEDTDTQKDGEVIVGQLERCKRVVEQLLVGAGDPAASGFERTSLATLVQESLHLWTKGSSVSAVVEDVSDGFEIEIPRIPFTQALINLLENAREAQEEAGNLDPIAVQVRHEGDRGIVFIRDRGVGLPEQGERIGDPFFTTKTTGTGLGVFVARAVAEGAGGGLNYASREGGGTEARWWFPEATRRGA